MRPGKNKKRKDDTVEAEVLDSPPTLLPDGWSLPAALSISSSQPVGHDASGGSPKAIGNHRYLHYNL